MPYIQRALQSVIGETLTRFPVVFLNGPRQAGKSTLVKHLVASGLPATYLTFDDSTAFTAASNDPEGFLRSFAGPVVIDEVQLVPGLFRALKVLVDEQRAGDGPANGRFLLTGSANVLALPGLSDALVGRMAVLTLYPFSAAEIPGDGSPVINGLFDLDFASGSSPAQADGLDAAVSRATFPEISGVPRAVADAWFGSYMTTLLQRDVRQLAEIEKLSALPNILNVLASRATGLLNDADSARDAKLNAMTYRRYRALLQQLFLIVLIPPWFRNVGKRFVKSPKLYFTDTALLCHRLGVDFDGLSKRNPGQFGRLTENFVATELIKQASLLPDGTLHHFRTQDGKEVDFVVERRSGALIGIEVKASASVTADDFSGLKALKEIAGKDFRRGIVLYLGRNTVAFGDGMLALPLETLWTLDMDVTTDKEVRAAAELGGYIFWADYGARTRVRCLISRETVEDHFHDNAAGPQALAAIGRHWDLIWPIIRQKIIDGRIEYIDRDHGPRFIAGRHQTIRQVTLAPQDFGFKDFRKAV
jgi:uncharacterized protein